MPKSVTRTVRLDEDLDLAIQRMARDSNMTVNLLVNKAARKLVEWDVPSQKIGMSVAPALLLSGLFEGVDGTTSEKLGRSVAVEFFKPFAEYLFGEMSVSTSILLFKRIADYGGRIVFDERADSRKHILIIRHERGKNFSIFYKGLLKGVFGDLLGKRVKVESASGLSVAQFDV